MVVFSNNRINQFPHSFFQITQTNRSRKPMGIHAFIGALGFCIVGQFQGRQTINLHTDMTADVRQGYRPAGT